MKKLLSMLLASAMLVAIPCQGADIDYASMSDADLQATADKARAELYRRHVEEGAGDLVLCDAEGVQVALTGDAHLGSGGYFRMDATFVNNSDKTISVYSDKGYLNGWEVYCSLDTSKLAPGKKARGELVFLLEDAGISTVEEIEDITLVFHITDTATYDYMWNSPEMQVFIDGEKVVSVQEIYTIG